MNLIRQIFIVTALGFKSLPQRFWTSMVIVVGLGATIGVLLSMMSMTTGISRAYLNAGDPGRAIVVSQGAESEGNSSISRATAPLIMDAPGIAKDRDGKPMADRALNMGVPVLRTNGTKAYTTMRGFGPKGVALRPEFHMVAGRMFEAGKREMIVGIGTQATFQNMKIGDHIIMPDGPWPIVGVYSTGDVLDGQVIGDTETVMNALHKQAYNSVLVRLASASGAMESFKGAMTTNPAISVTVTRHSDWYKKIADQSTTGLVIIAYVVGAVMAIGALFGCLNTMYAAVSARGREIATLRALGFAALPVAVSVILETMVLAVVGALIGAAIAWLLYDGKRDAFGQTVFFLTVSPGLVGFGVLWAVLVAFLGGLAPSIRAARRPVVEALRAT
jgi:putative ABC transport system permease protein